MIQVSRNCLQSGFNVVVSRLQIVIVSSNLCSFELDWSIVVMSNLARTLATVLRLSQRDILRFDCTKNRATPTTSESHVEQKCQWFVRARWFEIFGTTKSDNKILTTRKMFLPSTVLLCWTKNETYHYWKNQYCSYSNSTFEMAFVVGVAPILVHSSIHATLIDVVAVPNRYEYGLRYAVADSHFHPHFS